MSDEATVRVQPKVPARTSIFIDASAYSALVERGTIDDVRSALGKRRIDALFTYDLALDLCERDEAEPGLLAEAWRAARAGFVAASAAVEANQRQVDTCRVPLHWV